MTENPTVEPEETTSPDPGRPLQLGRPIVLNYRGRRRASEAYDDDDDYDDDYDEYDDDDYDDDYDEYEDDDYRYTRRLADVQRLERDLSKIFWRTAKAAEKGARTYEELRAESARRKRDGALRDYVPNMGEAWSEALSEASELPKDVARLINNRTMRRMLRRRLRRMSAPIRIWRL
ncbi:MAG: hypothetical protein L0332_34175 [Chloroflexi bacterium]|nr:hypothetical protein [Chloroflexota bacterium]MCI0581199.1 hypothetical protein [Chloroflexota bacterium]MCI0644123.1 hypothetical protein [Chloroflexota bacterium]MCI0731744.1 hypothetical protein [Chloroflexota bacterium]